MRIPFGPQRLEGKESVMDVTDFDIKQIRFKHDTREISVVLVDIVLGDLPWRDIKKLVEDNGGKYANKAAGILFLTEGGYGI